MDLSETTIRPNQQPTLDVLRLERPNAIRSGGINNRDRSVDERRLSDHECPRHHVHRVLVDIHGPVQLIGNIPSTAFVPPKRQRWLFDQQSLTNNLFFEEWQEA